MGVLYAILGLFCDPQNGEGSEDLSSTRLPQPSPHKYPQLHAPRTWQVRLYHTSISPSLPLDSQRSTPAPSLSALTAPGNLRKTRHTHPTRRLSTSRAAEALVQATGAGSWGAGRGSNSLFVLDWAGGPRFPWAIREYVGYRGYGMWRCGACGAAWEGGCYIGTGVPPASPSTQGEDWSLNSLGAAVLRGCCFPLFRISYLKSYQLSTICFESTRKGALRCMSAPSLTVCWRELYNCSLLSKD